MFKTLPVSVLEAPDKVAGLLSADADDRPFIRVYMELADMVGPVAAVSGSAWVALQPLQDGRLERRVRLGVNDGLFSNNLYICREAVRAFLPGVAGDDEVIVSIGNRPVKNSVRVELSAKNKNSTSATLSGIPYADNPGRMSRMADARLSLYSLLAADIRAFGGSAWVTVKPAAGKPSFEEPLVSAANSFGDPVFTGRNNRSFRLCPMAVHALAGRVETATLQLDSLPFEGSHRMRLGRCERIGGTIHGAYVTAPVELVNELVRAGLNPDNILHGADGLGVHVYGSFYQSLETMFGKNAVFYLNIVQPKGKQRWCREN